MSSSSTNFALRKAAEGDEKKCSKEVIHAMLNNCYLDDCLKFATNEGEAISMAKGLISRNVGFHLINGSAIAVSF